jgi:hypothetical protein
MKARHVNLFAGWPRIWKKTDNGLERVNANVSFHASSRVNGSDLMESEKYSVSHPSHCNFIIGLSPVSA